jgi:hypothetical protein
MFKNKFVIFLSLYLFACNIGLFSQEIFYVNENSLVYNNSIKNLGIYDIKLLNKNSLFSGYLIIQIDSNTIVNNNKLNTLIYWISINLSENIEDVNIKEMILKSHICDSNKYYFRQIPELIQYFAPKELSSKDSTLDSLTVFFHKYNMNFLANIKKDSLICLGHFIPAKAISNEIIWTLNSNTKIGYIIYETSFNTAIFNIEKQNCKFLFPISNLYNYKSIDENKLKNIGFTKSNMKIILKNFQNEDK